VTPTISVTPVRKQKRVGTDPSHAFEVFTKGMNRWWPRQHSINKSPIQDIVIEPRVNGRWFERGEDGSECQWGRVLVWDPPRRLVLAWQISTQWKFDSELETEVEIRFSKDGEETLVELEHRLQGYVAAAEQMHQIFDGPDAWAATLERYADAVGGKSSA
jgi:uncharacterized protein YndB with AHSA1/START domain